MSYTACATSALPSSERGTTVTWSCVIVLSRRALDDTQPAILSMRRIESPCTAVSPTPLVPGFVSKDAPFLTYGVPVPL